MYKMQTTPFFTPETRADIDLRVHRLQKLMQRDKTDAVIIAGSANMFYTSARVFRGHVYIPAEGEPVWFVNRPFGLEGAGVVYVRKPEQIYEYFASRELPLPAVVGLECDDLPYSEILRLSKVFPESEMRNASQLLRTARMVKTPFEIARMKEDGLMQSEVYRRVPRFYQEDMTDVEFQIEIERSMRLDGCLGLLRTAGHLMELNLGSVLYGDNADAPTPYDFALGGAGVNPTLPVGANGSIMRAGHTVMIDMNGCFNGYQTDLSRVWRIGEIPERAYKAHSASRRILRELEKLSVPGFKISEMCAIAYGIVAEEGLEAYFMGHTQQAGFIGHGVGIELNEPPVIMSRNHTPLEENMTIALEPKFVIPGVGAVGVENTYVVTPAGLKNITPFPEDIAEL